MTFHHAFVPPPSCSDASGPTGWTRLASSQRASRPAGADGGAVRGTLAGIVYCGTLAILVLAASTIGLAPWSHCESPPPPAPGRGAGRHPKPSPPSPGTDYASASSAD